MAKREDKNPWYKEPWPWILMAIPFLGIIGCTITIFLALEDHPDKLVKIQGYKQGLVVSRTVEGLPHQGK